MFKTLEEYQEETGCKAPLDDVYDVACAYQNADGSFSLVSKERFAELVEMHYPGTERIAPQHTSN